MGQAFSGPNAFNWLNLTPEATAVLRANPFLFAELVIVLVSCMLIILLAWYIHFVTNKVYKKPKSGRGKTDEKKKLNIPHVAPWVAKVGS
ncbi:hypothetical protein OIDMADRAFT_179031 [Oidiodendron maius Zn]|uniref:Uncharacterized protein n=1 Tax=Oidiodendron maius (strain Zn) TaxID=913774 RepID=A0A0C3HF04_OIDMZ|nr:hypothetical protein OIDMADRAFT_179031 [Oidiodendron maius Zn]